MGYRLLGLIVWKAARALVRYRYGHLIPSRRVAAAGVAALAIVGLIVVQRREGG